MRNKPKMAYSCNLPKMAILDYQGQSRTIMVYQGLSRTVMNQIEKFTSEMGDKRPELPLEVRIEPNLWKSLQVKSVIRDEFQFALGHTEQ